jgi:hypothetical protein
MMTKSLTKTAKKKSISNRNSQNVTVGTLADAQQQDGDKNNGGGSNGSSSSSNNSIGIGIGIGEGGKGNGENKIQKGRYCDFAQIEEEEYDVDYEIDEEGLLQALDESTTMAAAQAVQHQNISYLQKPVSLVSQLKPLLSLTLFFFSLKYKTINSNILFIFYHCTHASYLSHRSYELLVGLDHKDSQRNCTHFYPNHNYLISSHGCLMVVVGRF